MSEKNLVSKSCVGPTEFFCGGRISVKKEKEREREWVRKSERERVIARECPHARCPYKQIMARHFISPSSFQFINSLTLFHRVGLKFSQKYECLRQIPRQCSAS